MMLNDDDKNRDHGKIIWWGDRRYGFIRPDAADRDIFVHHTECELPEGESPRIGDRVTYVVGADRRAGKEPRVCALSVRFTNGEAT